jgi:hypothetical protein
VKGVDGFVEKEEKNRPGEKVMEREATINQNDSKEYLHSLLHEVKAIDRKWKAPEEEERRSKQRNDGSGRSNGQ